MSPEEETSHGTPLELQDFKRECTWCRESIRIDAHKCPHCGKWRKDIQDDLNKNVQWAICAIGLILTIPCITFGAAHSDIWGRSSFSLELFLSSLPGWIVLFFFTEFIISAVMANHYSRSAKRKTGGGLREI